MQGSFQPLLTVGTAQSHNGREALFGEIGEVFRSHGPRVLGFIGNVVEFLDRQGVNISPQADGGSVLRSPDDTYRAGHVIEQLYFTIVLFKNFSDSVRSTLFQKYPIKI